MANAERALRPVSLADGPSCYDSRNDTVCLLCGYEIAEGQTRPFYYMAEPGVLPQRVHFRCLHERRLLERALSLH